MASPYKAISERIVNAENNFVRSVVEIAGCTEAEAVKVMNLYRKTKIAKLDPVIGRISVKHGAFLERDVIMRAVAH